MEQRSVLFFVSHRSFGKWNKLEASYNSLTSAVNTVNTKFRDKLQISLKEFQKVFTANQTAGSLEEEALKAPCIIFLINHKMSERQNCWLLDYLELNKNKKKEQQVFLLVYWKKTLLGNYYRKKFEHETPHSTYIFQYSNLRQLEDRAQSDIKNIAEEISELLDKGGVLPHFVLPDDFKSRWAKQDNKGKNKYTLKRFLIWGGAIFLCFCLCIYLFWPRIQNYLRKEQSQEQPQEPSAIMVDTTRALLNDGITHVESLVKQKEYAQALDTLMTLKKICIIEWTDEIKKIDSLKIIVSDNLRPVPPISQKTSYIKNGCIVISNNPDIVSYVRGKLIDESSLSLSFPENGKTEWLVNVNIEKALDTDTVIRGVTVYKSIVVLTANIKQEGKYKGDKKYEGTARSYESKEKAFYDALQNALEGITKQIIEIIAQ